MRMWAKASSTTAAVGRPAAVPRPPSAVLGRDFDCEAGPLLGGVELATGLEARKARHRVGHFNFGGPSLAAGLALLSRGRRSGERRAGLGTGAERRTVGTFDAD